MDSDENRTQLRATIVEAMRTGLFLSGLGFGVLVWLGDPAIDAMLFGDGTVYDQMINPTPPEIMFRYVVSIGIVAFSFFSSVLLIRSRHAETRLKESREIIRRDYRLQTVISNILEYSLTPATLKENMQHALDVIFSEPTFSFLKKGSVFVADDDETLTMQVQHRLDASLQTACARLAFGQCLCGRAASSREIVFADHVDERHEIHYEGMAPHGHYCLPMLSGDRVLGVLNFYVAAGHQREAQEQQFLHIIADALAGVTERKRADTALKENEVLLTEAQELGHMGNWEWDLVNNKTTWSKEMLRLLGIPQGQELSFEAALDLVHPLDRADVRKTMRYAVGRGGEFDIECRLAVHDQPIKHVRAIGRSMRDGAGQIVRVVGITEDITERVAAEKGLRLRDAISTIMLTTPEDEMYERVLDIVRVELGSQFGIFGYISEDGDLVSPTLTASVWDRCEVAGKSIVFPREQWSGVWGRALMEKKTLFVNSGLKVPEGHIPLDNALACPILHGDRPIGMIAVANRADAYDEECVGRIQLIAAQIAPTLDARLAATKARKALSASEAKYRGIVEDQTELICRFDRDRVLTFVNSAFCRYVGKSADEIIGTTFLRFMQIDDRTRCVDEEISRLDKDSPMMAYEHAIRVSGDQIRWIHWNLRAFVDNDGDVREYQGIGHDITARKESEELLQTSHENLRNLAKRLQEIREEERTRIARDIHDELGQALTGLKMDLFWLRDRLPKTWKQLPQRTQAMISLIDSTIDFMRKLSTELRPAMLDDLGLEAAIEWQVQEFAARTDCTYVLDLGISNLRPDRDRDTAIFRVLQEALTNILRHAKADHVEIKLDVIDWELVLTVKDNGVGIRETDKTSSGSLGLISMQERAASLDGRFSIETMDGGGTAVTFALPVIGEIV